VRFAIGDIEVAVIVDDDDFPLPLRAFLPRLDLPAIEPRYDPIGPDFVDLDRDRLRCAIQSFALKLDRRTILVDACIGEHKDRAEIPVWSQRSRTGWLDRLRAAGVAPESVDFVFCTHLHIDHVGWNTVDVDGAWRPTFPNARYLVGRRELADWEARIAAGVAAPIHVRGCGPASFRWSRWAGLISLTRGSNSRRARRLPCCPVTLWATSDYASTGRRPAPCSAATRCTARFRLWNRLSRPPLAATNNLPRKPGSPFSRRPPRPAAWSSRRIFEALDA
jgi:hypothetical protein